MSEHSCPQNHLCSCMDDYCPECGERVRMRDSVESMKCDAHDKRCEWAEENGMSYEEMYG